MAVTSVRNETPSRLTLLGVEGERLELAPLEERPIEEGLAFAFDFDHLERDGFVRQGRAAPRGLGEKVTLVLLGGGFWTFLLSLGISKADPPAAISPEAWPWIVWTTGAVLLLAILAVLIVRGTNSLTLVLRFTAQSVALLVILTIGAGLPAATLYWFAGARELLDSGKPLAVFGRALQLAFIATASLLPVLLFFLFDQFQLGTLRKRIYVNLFRLDRSVTNIGDIDAKYGSQINEAFGDADVSGRLAPGSRWPVLVCAFVITVGWIIALAPVGVDFDPADATAALEELLPQKTAFVFGFLGVYFFSLRLIAVRYARGDLKPKAYTSIMVRVLIVAVLSFVLDAVFEGESRTMLVLAFLFGITPDEFFTWVKEAAPAVAKIARGAAPDPTKLPLTDLEGIDLYDRGRLESEGIVNIEGLAHHELIDLVIETRVPVPRLIDWMDQAILYLHVTGGATTGSREILRDHGIRTATDLLQSWQAAEARARAHGEEELEAFKQLLGKEKPYRLEVIRDALRDDEWMQSVLCWRLNEPHPDRVLDATPATIQALERWAEKEIERRRYGSALAVLESALAKGDTASTRLLMAEIHATASVAQYKKFDQAKEHAQEAYKLEPFDYANLQRLLAIYEEIEEPELWKATHTAALAIVESWSDGKAKTKELERLRGLGQVPS